MQQDQEFKLVMVPARNQHMGAIGWTPEGKLHENVLIGMPFDLYVVYKEKIEEVYPQIVVEQLADGSFSLWQIDNIHDIDEATQYKIAASTENMITPKTMLSKQTIKDIIEYFNATGKLPNIHIKMFAELTEGWIPTYSDPDNQIGHPPAEPTGNYLMCFNDRGFVLLTLKD